MGAGPAEPVKGDVVVGDGEAGVARDARDDPLELRVLERDHSTTSLADKVVMVFAARPHPLIGSGAGSHLQSLNETQPFELFERPVDAGPADRVIAGVQLMLDLERAEGAVLLRQQLDHGTAGTTLAKPGLLERCERVLDPVRTHVLTLAERSDTVAAIAASR